MKAFVHNRQIFFICLVPILGFGMFSTANTAVRYVSTSAWAAVLGAALLVLPAAVMLCVLAKRYPGDTIMEYAPKVAGKTAGNVLTAVYALFYLVFGGLLIAYFSHIVEAWVLPFTDYRLIAVFISLICVYALSKDFISLVRLVSFIGLLCVVAVVIMRILMIFSGDTSNLLPLWEPQAVKTGLLPSMSRIFAFFCCVGTLAVIPQNKSNKGSIIVVVSAILGAALLLAVVCAACISVLGVPQTALYKDAMVLAMKTFDISRSVFIQQADIVFIAAWALLILSAVCSVCYVPFSWIKEKTSQSAARKAGTASLSAALFIISIIPAEFAAALHLLYIVCLTLGILALFAVPLIILILSEVSRREKK